jgi:hypothetical protein
VRNEISIGDEFIYAENQTTTIVNILTGETTVTLVETICTERIAELEYVNDDVKGEVEVVCTWARFTPPNEREQRRLLFDRTRKKLQEVVESPTNLSVGDQWSEAISESINRYNTVARIYKNEEYDTEVVVVDTEIVGTPQFRAVEVPMHGHMTEEVDVQTGTNVLFESVMKATAKYNQITQIIVKKLIKGETFDREL